MTYIKGLLALQVVLLLLLYLAPGERYGKYIRFFAELVLLIGLLTPVCEWIYGRDSFLDAIDYETFTESIEQFSRDMEKMEYGKSEYFKEEYEQAISGEVAMTAGNLASAYGCTVAEASVKLTDEYTLQQMTVTLTRESGSEQTTAALTVKNGLTEKKWDDTTEALQKELAEFYGLEESDICVEYRKG